MGGNSLPKTVTRQRRGYDLNPGPSAPCMIINLSTKRILAISQWQAFLRVLPTRWRRKPASIDMDRNYIRHCHPMYIVKPTLTGGQMFAMVIFDRAMQIKGVVPKKRKDA